MVDELIDASEEVMASIHDRIPGVWTEFYQKLAERGYEVRRAPPYALITGKDEDEAERYTVLGPHYFTSRRVAQAAVSGLADDFFDDAIKEFSDKFYHALHDRVRDNILGDLEQNVQGCMWQTVDNIVKSLLSGQGWGVKRFLLGERYDCEKIREAVAKHVPQELQDARIKDLEAEVERLKKDLEWARRA